jgi:hypothetical protein
MESRVATPPAASRRQGRPHQLYVRRQTSLMLSPEEQQLLGMAVLNIQDALRPTAKVTKSQVFGMAVRVVAARLKWMPERVTSWDEVVKALIEGELE